MLGESHPALRSLISVSSIRLGQEQINNQLMEMMKAMQTFSDGRPRCKKVSVFASYSREEDDETTSVCVRTVPISFDIPTTSETTALLFLFVSQNPRSPPPLTINKNKKVLT